MTITTDEVAAEEARLANLHGVDLSALTPEDLRRVRGAMVNGATATEVAVVSALTKIWLSGKRPSSPSVAEEIGLARSTVGHTMKRLADGGVLVRLGGSTSNVAYIPVELYDQVTKEGDE